MSSERGEVDRQASGELTREPAESERDYEASQLEAIPDTLPACLDASINNESDRWFQHRGELLFERSQIPVIAERLKTIAETEFDTVEQIEASLSPWKTAAFIDAVEQRWQDVSEDHSFLVAVPTPNIEQQTDPRRAVISIEYNYNQSTITSEREWKREQILTTLREFDYWVYHTRVIQPAVEEVST